MDLINLGPTQGLAIAAVRKGTVPLMKPAKEEKVIVIRTRRNGSSVRLAKEAAKVRARAKENQKGKLKEAGAGRVMAQNYLAPTTTKGMATANGATIVASPTMDQKGESASTHPWPSKALRRNKRKK